MPLLARDFHVLAPDLIGFGNGSAVANRLSIPLRT
ncbi:hypothetical protein [Limosilactobacillus fermentum]